MSTPAPVSAADVTIGDLVVACLSVGWEVDDVANLLADPDGLFWPFDVAFSVAWSLRSDRVPLSTARRLLATLGVPEDPHATPELPFPSDAEAMREYRSGAIDDARHLFATGLSEPQIARTLMASVPEMTPQIAAEAAAIAATDLHPLD